MQQQVKYNLGDNEQFDYFIAARKEDVIINKDSIAYKIDPSSENTQLISVPGIYGNFDFLLIRRDKQGNFKGYISSYKEDIF
ncbi:MAG: hypothetical protein EOP00_21945 [Pedobacter sp.]|nr:MAG: hypothetical protein EOP00_21945 [Pedobacter sp.]